MNNVRWKTTRAVVIEDRGNLGPDRQLYRIMIKATPDILVEFPQKRLKLLNANKTKMLNRPYTDASA